MRGVLLRGEDRDTRREDGRVKTETEAGVMLPHAEAHLGLPEAGRGT